MCCTAISILGFGARDSPGMSVPTLIALDPIHADPVRRRRWLPVQSPMATAGLIIVVFVCLIALLAPWIAPHDFKEQQLSKSLIGPFWEADSDP